MAYWPGTRDRDRRKGFLLQCRGDVRLYSGTSDCTPRSKKARALLAILAAEARPLTRTRIVDLLWSESEEEHARASLRTLLADLREQFGTAFDDLLRVDRERVALGDSIRNDIAEPPTGPHCGELFESLDHLDPELDEWLRLERGRWSVRSSAHPAVSDIRPHLSPLIRYGAALTIAGALAAAMLSGFLR